MTEKEQFELAAKAAGIEIDHWRGDMPMVVEMFRGHLENYESWNPLINDGDALRLAVKLGLPVKYVSRNVWGVSEPATHCSRRWDSSNSEYVPFKEIHNDDPYAATRRAIVRAAAEIGKETK